jgi:LacI family transcriptional regulator
VLREMDLSIPDEVTLISFDDADWTDAVTPPLTVVSQPIRELAAAATEDLVARLMGEATDSGKETLLPATLIERDSVGIARTEPRIAGRSRKASS